jgi:hypothetical protein
LLRNPPRIMPHPNPPRREMQGIFPETSMSQGITTAPIANMPGFIEEIAYFGVVFLARPKRFELLTPRFVV